jgi:2-polyprenyl-3-methyl-5-hydroxy-6-metoxy-1,4-benzoquinol methylase
MPDDSGYSSQHRQEMLAFVPQRRARVLEIGCAEGHFLSTLKGVEERWGIEPSAAASVARQKLDRVLEATFEECEAELPLAYFDVIICNDVIEHMPDHDRFLQRIRKHMLPSGVLVGSIPNVRFYNNLFQVLFEKDWHYTDQGILDRTHLRFFTEKSLKKCFARHGFDIQEFSGINKGTFLGGDARWAAYTALSKALILVTLGYFKDIQYVQFGFRVAMRSGSS